MAAVVIDTDVASRLYSLTLPDTYSDQLRSREVYITFVTVAEMLRGARKAQWGSRRLSALENWLTEWPVIHSDDQIVRLWAKVVADSDRFGHNTSQNDAWIAACCLASEFPLATLNQRDFNSVQGLELLLD